VRIFTGRNVEPAMQVETIHNPPPLDALLERFGSGVQPFILDSAQSNNGLGHWSFFGADPFSVIEGDLEQLRLAMAPFQIENTTDIPFVGGAVGYISYDYGRNIETMPTIATDDRRIPQLRFGLYDSIAAYDHASGELHLIASGQSQPADKGLEALRHLLYAERKIPRRNLPPCIGPWEWNLDQAAFCRAVNEIKDYIAKGDVYQVNLSRRARCKFEGDPLHLYSALRKGNPGPYCAYLDTGDYSILSTSPEQFLEKSGRELVTRPIKGTRPRGDSFEEDQKFAEELARSPKERAELLMIVDLVRNDLGRVAEYGSVRVEDLYQIEQYSRVMHQTAQVKARLAANKDVYDCIHALFPGGSITGAPKIRAMQIIEELEPTRRNAYCGSIGYVGFDGDAEFNIAIRSLHLVDGYLDYQVGGGIVWDSKPEDEFLETYHKARAIHETIDALCRSQS
jgi:para-aminobenzoate synthetase component 1